MRGDARQDSGSTPVKIVLDHIALSKSPLLLASVSPSSFDDDMGRLLEMEAVLAYTTDRSGMKRFARALRGTLLSRAA